MDNRSPLDSLPQMSEISMTPLMDMTFLLLITFIITYPMIQQGIPLNLPKGNANELREGACTVSVDPQGRTYLDDRLVPMETLAECVAAIVRTKPDTTIYVRADESIRYGAVAKVLEVLHAANVTKLALVMQQAGADEGRRR